MGEAEGIRDRVQQEAWENFIMNSYMNFTAHKILLG